LLITCWLEEWKVQQDRKGKRQDSGKRKRNVPEEEEDDDETRRDSEEEEENMEVVKLPKKKKAPKQPFIPMLGTNQPCFQIPTDKELVVTVYPNTSGSWVGSATINSVRIGELEQEVRELREALTGVGKDNWTWKGQADTARSNEA